MNIYSQIVSPKVYNNNTRVSFPKVSKKWNELVIVCSNKSREMTPTLRLYALDLCCLSIKATSMALSTFVWEDFIMS